MLKSKFVGCLVGSAIGDALGSSLEGTSARQLSIEDVQFDGRWTDDTHMMMGIAESLIESRGFEGEHMAMTFIRNWEKDPWRGYGPGPPEVFRMIKSGITWDEAAKRLYGGIGSFGNGAAMRVAPVGLLYHDDTDRLRRVAYKSAMITHTHELGREGAAVQAYAVAKAVRRTNLIRPQTFQDGMIDFCRNEAYQEKLQKAKALLNIEDKRRVLRELGNGVEALNSVPTAIYCFAKNHQDYLKTVLYAVGLGGDTDTIAAMAGAIAGARHGEENLRKSWRSKLEKADYITELGQKLWELKKVRDFRPD